MEALKLVEYLYQRRLSVEFQVWKGSSYPCKSKEPYEPCQKNCLLARYHHRRIYLEPIISLLV